MRLIGVIKGILGQLSVFNLTADVFASVEVYLAFSRLVLMNVFNEMNH